MNLWHAQAYKAQAWSPFDARDYANNKAATPVGLLSGLITRHDSHNRCQLPTRVDPVPAPVPRAPPRR